MASISVGEGSRQHLHAPRIDRTAQLLETSRGEELQIALPEAGIALSGKRRAPLGNARTPSGNGRGPSEDARGPSGSARALSETARALSETVWVPSGNARVEKALALLCRMLETRGDATKQ